MITTTLLAVMGVALVGLITGPRLRSQSLAAGFGKPAGPKFEVASIKQAPGGTTSFVGLTANGARARIGYWSILQLIDKAYRIQSYQVVGPEWLGRFRFDLEATLPQGSSQKEIPEMLQWLLAERFGLVVHAERKQLRGFALAVGRGGLKMEAAPPEPNAGPDSTAKEEEADILDELFGSGDAFGASMRRLPNGEIHLEFQKFSMRALAAFLSADLRVPVTDQTGLKGKYRVTLKFDPATAANLSPPNEASSGGDLFLAVSRLGLRLERQSVSCNVLVLDHVEQVPTEN